MRSVRVWIFLLLTYGSLAWSHPGGTDEYGCHIDPDAGEFHCH